MSAAKKKKAQALLDAQIEYIIAQASSDELQQLIEKEIDHFYDVIEHYTLNDMVTPEQIKETIKKYSLDLKIHGAIPELVGELAQYIYDHSVHDDNTLNDLLTDAQFSEILEKSLEMEEFRLRVIDQAISNPIYAALVSDLLYNGIKDYLTDNSITKSLPGASSMMKLGKSVLNSAAPKLEKTIESNVKKYIKKNTNATLKQSQKFLLKALSNEKLTEVALETWDRVKTRKISSFRQFLSTDDIEDFLVLGYEYWKAIRKTSYYETLAVTGVDFFFEKYGDAKLTLILEEVSIKKHMLPDDAMRFAPPIIKILKEQGVIAEFLRRQLEPFYFSEATLDIL